jgi:hypothetical protein
MTARSATLQTGHGKRLETGPTEIAACVNVVLYSGFTHSPPERRRKGPRFDRSELGA